MKITVQTTVDAPLALVWHCWTTPAEIVAWNAASDDWHTTNATVDLREGGHFLSRMEAKDGSMGFDFEGTFTRVEPMLRISATFGDRELDVIFAEGPGGVEVVEIFDAETVFPPEQQQQGWQAILDRFAAHVVARHRAGS